MANLANPANLALEGGDPRLSVEDAEIAEPLLHDPNIPLEEYMFYAALSRRADEQLNGPNKNVGKISWVPRFGQEYDVDANIAKLRGTQSEQVDEKKIQIESEATSSPHSGSHNGSLTWLGIEEDEWTQANRALRTASWGAIFYLITTDILGPFSVPWALSQMGWVPGVILYFVFGGTAFYAGYQMWQMFMVLDSDKYPLRTYGDIAYRTMGPYARHTVNILQSIQLFFNVGILILSEGQAIYQLSQGPSGGKGLCFVVCNLVFTIAGFLLGQVRTLKRFGWIANAAIWINVLIMILTMAVIANTEPNYEAANAQNLVPLVNPPAPVYHYVGANPTIGFEGQVVGLMQDVYSYGGAMLYCEFMSEMKKPWDFFKAQFFAECFIFLCYIFFGCFIYGYQGQYTVLSAFPGISNYNWQSACNALSLVSALIAAALYGNIGIKVVYQNIGREFLGFPRLDSPRGKMIWVAMVPIYWCLAFVVCSGIPNITNFSSLIGAICIMQFSYTFPPIMMFFLDVQRDAMLPEETFDPRTHAVSRVDKGFARFKRGLLKKKVVIKLWYVVFALGSLCTAILGTYSSIKGLITQFRENPNVTSYGCAAPI